MRLLYIQEPLIQFGYEQKLEDPRDGLTLFGPLDQGRPYGIRIGVVGTADGVRRFKVWARRMQSPISSMPSTVAHPLFPGFEAAFLIPWASEPALELEVCTETLNRQLRLDDKYQRVFETVDLFVKPIATALREEETTVDVWCVMIPDEVKTYCRPKSFVQVDRRIVARSKLPFKYAKKLRNEPSLFKEDNIKARPYHYEVNFHNQLKAKLLEYNAPTQIIRESTIIPEEFTDSQGRPKRDLSPMLSDIAWHLSTAFFYKAGGRPWKIGEVRENVCYIGLVFKQDVRYSDPRSACCAAQLFLDSGDGIVFKGDVGPWYNKKWGEFHLNRAAARDLVRIAIETYSEKRGSEPKELFLHGKVRFNDEEWSGFRDGVGSSTNLVGVRIRDSDDIKLYSKLDHPVLRGHALVVDEHTAYLWTKGFVPRLQTYPGREVPRPLLVEVCRGTALIETVLKDILILTKLNYNACRFADGYPVTLKFADAVGEILTAGPLERVPPLPFRHYI
ncbi:MAG TPA: hypothetical protein VMY05_04895 [Acidobacteriota bacterium]|nr:hypothetical protein [Acidobacteriota bacterium]